MEPRPYPTVHEWTQELYESLPEIFRTLDKVQRNSAAETWFGFTDDPTFSYGWGEWQVSAPVQETGYITASMVLRVQGVAGEPVFVQGWWPDAISDDCAVSLNVYDDGSSVPLAGAEILDPEPGVAGERRFDFMPPPNGVFELVAMITVPAPEGNLFHFTAINAGPERYVDAADLPVGGVFVPAAFPLLRYLDGFGDQAGRIRDVVNDLWSGRYTDPMTVPVAQLRWLAQFFGVPNALIYALDEPGLREYMVDMSANGRKAVGTRQAIGDAAKQFLTGSRMVEVVPHPTLEHTIIILVSPEEVPGMNLQGIVETVRAAGVIPAGHDVIAKEAIATWDEFDAASGVTWDQYEVLAPTWVQHDSLGINLGG